MAADITCVLKETPTKYELFNVLFDFSDKWYDIGLSLQVHCDVLDDLKQSEGNDITKFEKVINIWKNTQLSSVTWETVITAFESPTVNDKEIPDLIRQYLRDVTSILKKTPTKDDVCFRLFDIRDKWCDIGLSLQVRHNVLDDLTKSEVDNRTKLKKVINIWIDTQPSTVTWETVIAAFDSPINNKKEIADYIYRCLKIEVIKRLRSNRNPDTEISESGNIAEEGVHVSTLPDHFLNQQPTYEELISHARTAEWNVLSVKLGLNSVDLAECHDCTRMYQVWIMEKGRGATRRSLLNALRDIRQNNVADTYEDYLKTRIHNSMS